MRIQSVLSMDSGKVVCVENGATITIEVKGGVKTFRPSFPKDSPALSEMFFTDMYKHKHFNPSAPAKASKASGKKEDTNNA